MKALFLVSTALMVMAAAPPAQRGSLSNRPLQFVDLTENFDRAWTVTKDLPDSSRVEAFEAEFSKVLPGFYSAKRVSDFITPERYREMILKGLKDYPEQRAGIRRVSRQFSGLIAPARREFEAYFGPMRGYPSIYLVNSLGEFDGGTRPLSDGSHLMFGADMVDKLYNGKPIKPFVEHELFHLMHHRTFKNCQPVWCNLWEEGLATYVASKFNPGVDDVALGLTVPAPIRPAVEANRSAAICAVRTRLDSVEPADYAPLFYGNQNLPSLPARMGYYVGLLVVQDAGQTRDLKQLAALPPAEVRPLIAETLARQANCAESNRS
jgi:hypothetical protein